MVRCFRTLGVGGWRGRERRAVTIMDFSAPRQASVREIQIREANFYFFVDDVASFLHHGTPGTMAIR